MHSIYYFIRNADRDLLTAAIEGMGMAIYHRRLANDEPRFLTREQIGKDGLFLLSILGSSLTAELRAGKKTPMECAKTYLTLEWMVPFQEGRILHQGWVRAKPTILKKEIDGEELHAHSLSLREDWKKVRKYFKDNFTQEQDGDWRSWWAYPSVKELQREGLSLTST